MGRSDRRKKGGKQPADPPQHQRVNRVRDLAARLGANWRPADMEAQLATLRSENLSQQEWVAWHVLWTMTSCRRGDRQTALARAVEAANALPDEPEIAFVLGQELEFRGDTEEMVRAFRRAPFPQVSAAYTLAAARYCYLHGQFDAALELLRPVLEAHFALKIADDTWLYIRQMPFANTTFAAAACLYLLKREFAAARALIQRGMTELLDGNVADLGPFVDAHEKAAPSIAVEALESELAPDVTDGPHGGFLAMRLAVWRSRTLGSLAEVDGLFTGVDVGEADSAWLKDVRTLARAEACDRFGDRQREEGLIRAFVEGQPLLFEPAWALQFGFISYQERLRCGLWKTLTDRDPR